MTIIYCINFIYWCQEMLPLPHCALGWSAVYGFGISWPYYYVINQVISYWLSYRSEVSCIGPRRRPSTYTADQGPVTEPIRNHLINDIFIN